MSEETIRNITHFGWDMFSGEVIMSLIVMGIIIIFSFIVYFKFRKLDPTKPDKGFVMVVESAVDKLEGFTVEMMGNKWRHFSGYALGLAMYILLSFLVSLIGFPGPLTYLGNTLSIALCTFFLIHITAMKKNKLGYFKRYIDPIPVLLPVNLLSMWAPLLSLSLRLFGNALAGYTLMSIVYYFLGIASDAIFGGLISSGASNILIAPFITPVLHLYFDIFSGLIQTLIFVMLTMIFVSQEDPEEEDSSEVLKIQKGKA